MEHQKLDKTTVDYVLRQINSAIRMVVDHNPIAIGVLVTKLTYQLSSGSLGGIVSTAYIQTHVQEAVMKLIGKQHVWATIQTIGNSCDIYVTAAQYYKQPMYRYEV